MAVVYRVPNGKIGDGAGRSRYLLSDMEKVLGIRTNAPLSPLPDKSLANDWNRFLKSWQGDYRTTHLIVSFPQLLNKEQIEEILEYLDKKLPEYVGDRFHLIVVHREVFNEKSLTPEEILEVREGKREAPEKIDGTAFHIVLSADSEGKLLRLHPKKFKEMKLEFSEYLTRKFGNEREKEVLRNFRRGIRTRDPFKRGEIKIRAPEKLEKVRARKLIREIIRALESRDIDTAIKIQKRNRMEFVPYKKGQLSPWNKTPLKEDTVYLFMPKDDGSGIFCMQLPKRAKVLWEEYQTVFSEVENELGIIEAEARQDRERTEKLRDKIKTLERQRSEIERANTELRERVGELASGAQELERENSELKEGIQRNFREIESIEVGDREASELEQAIRAADSLIAEDREFEARDFERIRNEIEHIYEQVRGEFGITREELERDIKRDIKLEIGNSGCEADRGEGRRFEDKDRGNGRQTIDRDRRRREKEEIHSSTDSGRGLGWDGRSFHGLGEKSGFFERSGEQSEENGGKAPRGNPKENDDYLGRSWNTGDSSSPKPIPKVKVKKSEEEEIRTWILEGKEITEEEIIGNPAFFLDCEIEEVRKLARNFLMEELDEEYQFLEAEGYFRDIEKLEIFDKFREEIREKWEEEKEERKLDNDMGLGL